jgi:DNA-binding transcriptional LysR family regulator
MEFRHLRYFIVVAEELHYARAAARLHINQSPLSRAIAELERDLGVQLLERTTRSTRLTAAGKAFLIAAKRILCAQEQARASAKAVASGYCGSLRIAVSEGVAHPRLVSLLARCREEDPDVKIELSEVTLVEQLEGLRTDLYDAGFAHAPCGGEGIAAQVAWSDALVVAVPARHPLLATPRIAIEELIRYPIILCTPELGDAAQRSIERLLLGVTATPAVIEQASSLELMLTMVSAGYGVGFANESLITACRRPEIVTRPLAGQPTELTTYLLRPAAQPCQELSRFIDRAIP